MFKVIKNNHINKLIVLLIVVVIIFISGSLAAEEELIGSGEFYNSCASCHGVGAKGDGNLAKYLNIEPTDLTLLSKKNHGEYPFLRVFQIIDGRSIIAVHGDRLMPVWGDRYSLDAAEKYGPRGGEAEIRARVLELVYYLQSIQQK
jgi:hypothetical protein